ncbi:spore germination protein [Neobacillus sp. PS2-9]|uniref:spore germination protein n=1 Tax=Neobacillus sp. PS2-9 TaxID=3070676 RepID=UPI0027DFBC6A|nr:spore germination protein [Neobacillus sp. PS2-9]WML59412.1 spore germination protein [Neobacillus sp. PS2-9]
MENNLDQHLKKELTANYEENKLLIQKILTDNGDLIVREFFFHQKKNIAIVCFYIDGLVNTNIIGSVIDSFIYQAPRLLRDMDINTLYTNLPDKINKHILHAHSVKLISKVADVIDAILSGDSVFIIEKCDQAILVSTRGWADRAVSEPQTEQVVIGPRDGFTENLRTNTALVRRRIKDPLLSIKSTVVGKSSKTTLNIAYHRGTVKKGLVEEVMKRLDNIDIDGIIDSGYISELIEDAPLSPFTTVQSTERPDKVAASILEGRVAIFVDNSPFVLIVPTYFWQFLQASDDYYSRYMAGSFFRLIRYFAFIISLVLTSIYVMLVSFHQEMIPTALALTIASGREVVPFPVLIEALIMEISFELMREAGLRMPKPVGQAVSIVGSLVIGQAAVQAGLVSPFMVIIVAITGIASFVMPNYAASFSIRLVRFPLLIASGTLGLLGFTVVFSLIAIHALSLRSFGESYLAPATPFQPSDQKDMIIRFPWWSMERLPHLAKQRQRASDSQKPKNPQGNNNNEG